MHDRSIHVLDPWDPGLDEEEKPTVLSVCSSVGGKDLGFHRAGFRTVGLCEWDEWRREVLAARWPGVPIHGDLAALADWAEQDPDAVIAWLGGKRPRVLIGGTPCQDLSHAGRRAGIDGERSGLFWAFIRLRNALNIEWTVWENVAGALTSNGGLDFMAVLGAFVGAPVSLPGGRVRGAGVAAGPWGGCVWRLLNAQHFGVPQRRRRVFVVGRLGGPCPPEVLLEPHRGGRDSEARRAAGQVAPWAVAAALGDSRVRARGGLAVAAAGGGRGRGGDVGGDGALGQRVAGPLGAHSNGSGVRNDLDSHGAYVAPTLTNRIGQTGGHDGIDDSIVAVNVASGACVDADDAGSERGRPGQGHGVSAGGDLGRSDAEGGAGGAGPAVQGGRRGDRDRVPPARADGRAEGRRQRADADEVGKPGGEHGERAAAADADGVRAPDGLAGRVDDPSVDAVSIAENQRGELRESDVVPSLSSGGGKPGQGRPVVAVSSRGRDGGATLEIHEGDASPALRGSSGGGSRQMVVEISPRDGVREDPDAVGTLMAQASGSHSLTRNQSAPLVLDTYNQAGVDGEVTNTLSTSPTTAVAPTLRGSVGSGGGGQKDDATVGAELGPDPDDDRDPPPDGRRFAACGDGVTGPQAHWIGLRLRAVMEGRDPEDETWWLDAFLRCGGCGTTLPIVNTLDAPCDACGGPLELAW